MANLQGFLFFDFNSVDSISKVLSNSSIGESITIEVESDRPVDLVVQGRTDFEPSDNWHTIGVITLTDYDIINKITQPGLYVVPFEGIQQCRIKNNGPVGGFKVYAMSTGAK